MGYEYNLSPSLKPVFFKKNTEMKQLDQITAYESSFPYGTIVDGVIDGEKYLKSKPKIAWFLKEPYSDEKDGFHIKSFLAQIDAYKNFFRNTAMPTWHTIIYVSNCILREYEEYDQIPWIKNKIDLCDVVKEIAIINVNKYASEMGTYTHPSNLKKAFPIFKELISRQIKVLDPDILIFGYTFQLYKEMFDIKDIHKLPESINNQACDLYLKGNKLFIDTYHPSNRQLTREIYCNQILSAVNKWRTLKWQ